MFRPGFPRLSHPGLAHAAPSTGFMAKVYRGAGKLTDQQRAEQAPVVAALGGLLCALISLGSLIILGWGTRSIMASLGS